MKRIGFWVLILPLLLAGVASAADGDRRDSDRSRPRDASDWRDAMRKRMEEATKKFDKDGDGKLSESERRAMFESIREQWSQRGQRPGPSADRREDSRESARRPAWPPRPQFGQFSRGPWGGPPMGRGPWGWGAPPARGPWGAPMARGPFGRPSRPEASRSDKKEDSKKDEAKKHDRGPSRHARAHHDRGHHGRFGWHRGDHHRRMAWGHHHRGHGERAHGDRHHGHRHGSAEGKRDGDKPSARPERSPSDREAPRPERRRGEDRRPRA